MRSILGVVVALAALWAAPLAVVPVLADPAFPDFTAPVVDAAHILSQEDEQALDQRLLALRAKTGVQFAVAIVQSLDGEEIEPYANALFRHWKIGTKDVNNGLLLVVAPKEHRLRFEVGYGLEGTMTDVQANLIVTNAMVPKLKAGDPAGAIKIGVDDAIKVLGGDASAVPTQPAAAADQPLDPVTALIVMAIILFVVFVFALIVIRAVRRGKSGWTWGTGAGAGAASTWSSGDDNSSSGSGGFSGGGGGDSGGGGASGSW